MVDVDSDLAIRIKGLKKSFGKVKVLEGIDLEVKRGSIFALLGPNGAGKTTTVKILSTLIKPDAGEIRVNGFDVVKEAKLVRHNIGLTGQYAAVDELLSGRENIVMMGQLYHLSYEQSVKRADELLKQFDLLDAADRSVKTYSGGMRRRLDLAASLVATPPIIFLDEPTTGLDAHSRLTMWDIIKDLKRSNVTILLTTQNLEEADTFADTIAVMYNGKIIALGTPEELKKRVGHEWIELLIEESSDFDNAIAILNFDEVQYDRDSRMITLPIEGSVKSIKKVLDILNDNNISMARMSVRKPTLDEVFLQLTGHRSIDEQKKKNEKTKKNKR